MNLQPTLALFLIILFSAACESSFDFEVSGQEFMVIDGYITDDSTSISTIVLSRSQNYNTSDYTAVGGAVVYVDHLEGISYFFLETRQGVYQSPVDLRGKVGESYQLNVVLMDGTHYVSRIRTMPMPILVDTIHWAVKNSQILNAENEVVAGPPGVQFTGGISFPDTGQFYAKWDYVYDFQFNTEFEDPEIQSNCYVPGSSDMILDVYPSNQNDISEVEIVFDDLDFRFNHQINYRFRLLSMDRKSYAFYDAIHQQKLNTGSLFDPIPETISSEFINLANPEEVVLGDFGVFSTASRVVSITNLELGIVYNDFMEECYPTNPTTPPADYCFDCSLYPGASTTPPLDWFE